MEKRKNTTKKKGLSNEPSLTNREFSAGGIVFKNYKNKTFWLITKSTPSEMYPNSYWRLPKGWLDDAPGSIPGLLASGQKKATEEEIQKAAVREVKEEGGVEVKIVRKVGTERVFFTRDGRKILKFVTYYLMEFKNSISGGPGFETAKTNWLSYEKAISKLKYPSERRVLEKAKHILNTGLQENLV